MRPLQHRRRGHDGRLHDVPELRRFQVRVSATVPCDDQLRLTEPMRNYEAHRLPLFFPSLTSDISGPGCGQGVTAARVHRRHPKKTPLGGVSVACLCVEEFRSRCYSVWRGIRRAVRLFGPTLSSVIPSALPSRTFVLVGRYKQHACQPLRLAVRCDKVSPARAYSVTQCALREPSRPARLAAPRARRAGSASKPRECQNARQAAR